MVSTEVETVPRNSDDARSSQHRRGSNLTTDRASDTDGGVTGGCLELEEADATPSSNSSAITTSIPPRPTGQGYDQGSPGIHYRPAEFPQFRLEQQVVTP